MFLLYLTKHIVQAKCCIAKLGKKFCNNSYEGISDLHSNMGSYKFSLASSAREIYLPVELLYTFKKLSSYMAAKAPYWHSLKFILTSHMVLNFLGHIKKDFQIKYPLPLLLKYLFLNAINLSF